MRTTFTPEEIVRWTANDIQTANDIERLGLHGFDPSIRQIMRDLHSLALSPTREDDAVAELEHRIVQFLGRTSAGKRGHNIFTWCDVCMERQASNQAMERTADRCALQF